MENLPPEVAAGAERAKARMIPASSNDKYAYAYNAYAAWRNEMKLTSNSETVLLAYFEQLSNKYSPNTLWSIYSMIRSKMIQLENLDISKYNSLKAFLKQTNAGYHSKQAKVFTAQEIENFLNKAPDIDYLDVKVIAVFGILGACRHGEMPKIMTQDIEDHGQLIKVTIRSDISKNKQARSFVIEGGYRDIVQKYRKLRPPNFSESRFFVRFEKGKGRCTRQVIGEHKFAEAPKVIARFLNLPDATMYTGHSFRRTSATMLVDGGADIMALQRHGGWKSATVAMKYVDESLRNKKDAARQITSKIVLNPAEKKTEAPTPRNTVEAESESEDLALASLEVIPDDLDDDFSDIETALLSLQDDLQDINSESELKGLSLNEAKQSHVKCLDENNFDSTFDQAIANSASLSTRDRSPLADETNRSEPQPLKKPKIEKEETPKDVVFHLTNCVFNIYK